MNDIRLIYVWNNLQDPSQVESIGILKNDLLKRARDRSSRNTLTRSASARCAELATLEFFQEHGCTIEDVSITQLNKSPNDRWKYYDLLVQGDKIDVKNTRRVSYDSGRTEKYSELRVQKPFKSGASSDDGVLIAGVLSPYFDLDHILNPASIPAHYSDRQIQVLGLYRQSDLASIKRYFEIPGTLELDLRRPESKFHNFLPYWLFDYPEEYYTDQYRLLKELVGMNCPTDSKFWNERRISPEPAVPVRWC